MTREDEQKDVLFDLAMRERAERVRVFGPIVAGDTLTRLALLATLSRRAREG